MKREFEILKVTRNNFLKIVNSLSEEQLVKIPQGFNNNILWNAGHIVSSSQKLTYGLAGVPMRIAEDFPKGFAKGTGPKEWSATPNIKQVKEYLTSTPPLLEEDYNKGLLKSFKEYETSYGFTMKSIEEAISFCNTHEALHLGVIMAMRKLV